MHFEELDKNKNSQIYALERGSKMILSFVGPQGSRLSYLVENVELIDSEGKVENTLRYKNFDNSKLFDKNNNINVFSHGEGSVYICGVENYHFGFTENQTFYTRGLGFLCSEEEGVSFYSIPSLFFTTNQENIKVIGSQEENLVGDETVEAVWQIDTTCQQ